MTYEKVLEWINKESMKDGVDFIAWEEIKNKVNERTFYYVKIILSAMNGKEGFNMNNDYQIEYAKKLMKETIFN